MRWEKVEICEDWFKFCTKSAKISPSASISRIKMTIDEWSSLDMTQEEILKAAENTGFGFNNNKGEYRFRLSITKSTPFMKSKRNYKDDAKLGEYCLYHHNDKEQLLPIHEYLNSRGRWNSFPAIESKTPGIHHKLEKGSKGHFDLISINSYDENYKTKIVNSLTAIDEVTSPFYIKFLEYLLKLEPDYDFKIEEKILTEL
jgi:hypothetical protein